MQHHVAAGTYERANYNNMTQDQLKQLHALNKHTQADRIPVKWIEVDSVVTLGCASSSSVKSFVSRMQRGPRRLREIVNMQRSRIKINQRKTKMSIFGPDKHNQYVNDDFPNLNI